MWMEMEEVKGGVGRIAETALSAMEELSKLEMLKMVAEAGFEPAEAWWKERLKRAESELWKIRTEVEQCLEILKKWG